VDHPIVIFGAGAIGLTVGGWLLEAGLPVRFLARGDTLAALNDNGLTLVSMNGDRTLLAVDASDDPSIMRDADAVILAVKNYSLEQTAPVIAKHAGEHTVTVAVQNGLINQQVLPLHLQRVVYGIAAYNAWVESPGVVGWQKRGPLILGAHEPHLLGQRDRLTNLLNQGVETVTTDRLRDAAYCKIVINLTNSLTTLIGHGKREIANRAAFQRLLSGMIWEGIRVLRAAGMREVKMGGLPPWGILWAGAHLPRLITRPLFERNVKKMVLSSMAQDVDKHMGELTELEDINGEILRLAEENRVDVPINRAVYALCRERFSHSPFRPVDPEEIESRL